MSDIEAESPNEVELNVGELLSAQRQKKKSIADNLLDCQRENDLMAATVEGLVSLLSSTVFCMETR